MIENKISKIGEYSRLKTQFEDKMAARMELWNAEQDIDDELADVDLNLAIGSYGQTYDDAQPQIDEATLAAAQQMMAQQAAFAQIPDVVKRFIVHFHQAVLENNLQEITLLYESGWNKLTEKFYAKTEWPEAEVIAPLVGDDPVFLILYRELYYRHVYSRLSPNIFDRFHSYENSCELFNYLLNSDGPVKLELPDQWLWDIIDEFIYQFRSFSHWRSHIKTKTDEELQLLSTDGGQVWSCYSVLNVLYSFIQKSKITENMAALNRGASPEEIEEIVGEFGTKSLYKMLGYFSIIGLLRVHTLLGDFTLALKVMDNVELNQKTSFTRVTACHVATYYYVGFCYMALRRYPDAIRTFTSILNFISRMKQFHTRSYQYDEISKTADRMYALFAICHALAPSRVDDAVQSTTKEKFGEQINKMTRGEEGLPAFEELYLYACPKFISANIPPYHDIQVLATWVQNPPVEPHTHHLTLFLREVSSKIPTRTLRSSLRLYASLDARKLAGFLDVDEEEMVCALMVLKMSGRSVCRIGEEGAGAAGVGNKANAVASSSTSGSLLDGQMITTSDFDFVITENMIKTVETTVGRRYAGWFIRNGEYAQRVLDGLKSAPLPGPIPNNANGGGRRGGRGAQSRDQGQQQQGQTKANGAGPTNVAGPGSGQDKKVTWKV